MILTHIVLFGFFSGAGAESAASALTEVDLGYQASGWPLHYRADAAALLHYEAGGWNLHYRAEGQN